MASSPPGPQPLTLTVLTGPTPGESLSKPGATMLRLGRIKTGNTFVLKVPSVSSKHVELAWDDSEAASGGTWFLVDVGSSNGTQINGNSKCLEGQRYPLRDRDIIQLGPDTQLQVSIEVADGSAASITVEEKLTADAHRMAQSIQAAADAMASQVRDEWRKQRQELESMLAC